MRTTSVQNRAGRCGKVFQEMAEMLREGCGKVNSLLRDSVTQVLDFIAGRSGHFCGKVRVAVSFPLKGEYPAGLLEVGPAGYPTRGMIAACSETGVPVLKIGIDPAQKAPRPMRDALARAPGGAEFTSAEVGQGLVRFHLSGTDHRTVPAAMPSHRLTCGSRLTWFERLAA